MRVPLIASVAPTPSRGVRGALAALLALGLPLQAQTQVPAPEQGGSPDLAPAEARVQGLGAGWPASAPLPQPLADPAVDQLQALTMERVVDLANARNPVVRSAYLDLISAQNSLGATYARWWPVLNSTLNGGLYGARQYYNYLGGLTGGFPIYGNSDIRSFSGSYFQSIATIDITWNLIDPARTASLWKSKYEVRKAADTYIIARRDNKLKAESAYIDLQAAFAGVQATGHIVENARLLQDLVQTRLRLGVSSKVDLAKQTTVLLASQVNQQKALEKVDTSRADLAELIVTSQPAALTPGEALAPLGSWPHDPEQTLAASEAYRKVLEQKLMDIRINEAQAEIYLATYRPTIALVNQLYWTKGVGYNNVGPPWPGYGNARTDFWNGSALLQITLTGFDGGQARMQAAASRRKADSAREQYRQELLAVRKDVQTLLAKVNSGRAQLLLSSRQVETASQAVRLQSMRFNAGYGTLTDVVQAQQDLTNAVISYIDILQAYNTALVELSRSSGLIYRSDPELSRAVGDPLARLSLPSSLRRIR